MGKQMRDENRKSQKTGYLKTRFRFNNTGAW